MKRLPTPLLSHKINLLFSSRESTHRISSCGFKMKLKKCYLCQRVIHPNHEGSHKRDCFIRNKRNIRLNSRVCHPCPKCSQSWSFWLTKHELDPWKNCDSCGTNIKFHHTSRELLVCFGCDTLYCLGIQAVLIHVLAPVSDETPNDLPPTYNELFQGFHWIMLHNVNQIWLWMPIGVKLEWRDPWITIRLEIVVEAPTWHGWVIASLDLLIHDCNLNKCWDCSFHWPEELKLRTGILCHHYGSSSISKSTRENLISLGLKEVKAYLLIRNPCLSFIVQYKP